MKLAAVCQSGLGTSFMVQMNIESLLEEAGLNTDDFELSHMDVGSVSPDSADYFFVEFTLADSLPNVPPDRIVPLKSLIDKDVAREALYSVLDKEGISHN